MYKVILNGDILQSVASCLKPINKDKFMDLFLKYGFGSMLSIGWTTIKRSTLGYTWSDMFEMIQILNKLSEATEMVTIPVDVHMTSLNSIPKLILLLDNFKFKKISLTLWTYKDVEVNIQTITTLRKKLSKSSIYMDIPHLLKVERDYILAVQPSSENIQTIVCSNIIGNKFWSSRSSVVIGKNTHISFKKMLSSSMEFFIVFDNIKSESTEDLSICNIQLNFDEEIVELATLSKDAFFLNDQIRNDNYFEVVYFCSLNVLASTLSLTVFNVEKYNTCTIEKKSNFSIEVTIEEHKQYFLTFNSYCFDESCRFIVIDF